MPTDDRPLVKEYLSLKELCDRIPYQPQTIYNWIYAEAWKEGEQYFKPTPRKLLFFWPAIESWIRRDANGRETEGLDDTDD